MGGDAKSPKVLVACIFVHVCVSSCFFCVCIYSSECACVRAECVM